MSLTQENLCAKISKKPAWIYFENSTIKISKLIVGQTSECDFTFSTSMGEPNQTGDIVVDIITSDGTLLYKNEVPVKSVLGIEENTIEYPYPNPANPDTRIKYSLIENSHVTAKVYNMLGQMVRELLNKDVAAGTWEVYWDGRNSNGQSAASGLYLVRLAIKTADSNKFYIKKIAIGK